jgi:hypothetical protein
MSRWTSSPARWCRFTRSRKRLIVDRSFGASQREQRHESVQHVTHVSRLFAYNWFAEQR